MDLELCWGAQARRAQPGRASIAGRWLQALPCLALPFPLLRGPTGHPARSQHSRSEHPQERAQPSHPCPAPLVLGTTSSLCPGILASDFPIFPPGRFLRPVWGAGSGNAAPLPSLGILPDPNLSSLAPWMRLCSAALLCFHRQPNSTGGSA